MLGERRLHDLTKRGCRKDGASTEQLASLRGVQGAARSFAFASGMAALSAVLRLARAGDHVVAGDDIYGGTSRLLCRVAPDLGLAVTNVSTTDVECAPPATHPSTVSPHESLCPAKAEAIMPSLPTETAILNFLRFDTP